MAKNYKLKTVKSRRSYSFREIAGICGVHIRTVQMWRKEGLETLVGTQNPYLVMGCSLKSFLSDKRSKRRTKLKDNELYCLVCRKGVEPLNISAVANGTVGNSKKSVVLKGTCPICRNNVRRFAVVGGSARTEWDKAHPREY